jgi:ABC-type Fe3+-hydroxamate transport system substrate-binding protein
MKTQIYFYKLFLFGHKGEDDYISLSQIQGQQLSMILATDPSRKFIMVDENLINTSAIEQLAKSESMTYTTDGTQRKIPEVREITGEEEMAQEKFNAFKNKIKLLK